MTIHWRQLKTAGRIEAIRSVYQPNMSTRQIAAALGVEKGAVCGMYHRFRDQLADCPLPAHGKRKLGDGQKARQPSGYIRPAYVAQPVGVLATVGRPIMALGHNECRWPVNDDGYADTHLFCGSPAKGPYCDHHTSKAYRTEPNQCGS